MLNHFAPDARIKSDNTIHLASLLKSHSKSKTITLRISEQFPMNTKDNAFESLKSTNALNISHTFSAQTRSAIDLTEEF